MGARWQGLAHGEREGGGEGGPGGTGDGGGGARREGGLMATVLRPFVTMRVGGRGMVGVHDDWMEAGLLADLGLKPHRPLR